MKNKLWLAALLILAACGGGSDGDALKFEANAQQSEQALCEQFTHCGIAASVDECLPAVEASAVPPSATLVAAVASGKVTFDGAAARDCYDAIAGAACEVTAVAYRARPVACLNIFHGSVAEAAACTIDQECVSQHCAVPSCDMACCPGTCTGDAAPVLAAVSESCDNATCDEHSYCDQVARECVALKGANGSCESFEACADGLYCLLSGVCGSLPAEGQTCDSDGCQRSNDFCSPDTHVCTAAGTSGVACADDSGCSSLYTCDDTKHCSAGLELGAACRIGDRCLHGARCETAAGEVNGTCQPRHAAGAPCDTDGDCVYKCDQTAGSCIADQVCN